MLLGVRRKKNIRGGDYDSKRWGNVGKWGVGHVEAFTYATNAKTVGNPLLQLQAREVLDGATRPKYSTAKKKASTPLSSGAIKDLSYISLCYGLFKTALEIEDGTCSDDGAIKRNHYKTSKRLNRRIEKLRDRLYSVMQKYAHESPRVRKINEKLFRGTMVGTEPTQLDYLGVFIYLLRFYERDKPVMEDFKVISESELYELSDLVGMTQAGGSEGRMYELACEMVKVL